MKSFVMRGAAAIGLVTALLIAGCGGGGGSPGACLSGSPQVCGTESTAPAVPETYPAWAEICTLDGVRHYTRNYLNEVYLWYRELRALDPLAYTDIGRY